MFGLGMDLTAADFVRIGQASRAVVVALTCQLALLPAVAFGLIGLFGLDGAVAVGVMLLAASPGGAVANLYSHLFKGDVALNISLTALNAIIAVLTLPLIVNLALGWFMPGDESVGLQFSKLMEVFLIVLAPVAAGMVVRAANPLFAKAMDRPVRIGSAVLLAVVVIGAILANIGLLLDDALALAGVVTLFCLISLGVGFGAPRLFGVGHRQAVACAFEVGLHNATLAIVIAQSVLSAPAFALPAAVYGVAMFPLAAAFGFMIRRNA